jgi:hypothetical protein
MFNIFRLNDEFKSKLVKQCPSCHGFIKGEKTKCRHCGNSIQQVPVKPLQHKKSEDRSDSETDRFLI